VCYSVLHCPLLCCIALWCVAECCSVLYCLLLCCSVLWYVAVCCGMLQCVAVCCISFSCVALRCGALPLALIGRDVWVYLCWATCRGGGDVLINVVCCSVLQCVAVCCSVLAHTTRHAELSVLGHMVRRRRRSRQCEALQYGAVCCIVSG